MEKEKKPVDKGQTKMQPDQGQGSEGNFGHDGDHGKDNDDAKKSSKNSSPIPIKKAK